MAEDVGSPDTPDVEDYEGDPDFYEYWADYLQSREDDPDGFSIDFEEYLNSILNDLFGWEYEE